MLEDENRRYAKVTATINKRGKNVLEKFGKTAIEGLSQPTMLSVVEDVKTYWKDTYRPALTSFSCEAVGGQPETTEDLSLMITLMAAGLGIHDDIIDKSKNKHFRMTILGLHGLERALLAGELFMVKSITTIKNMIKKNYPQEKIVYFLEAFESFFIEVWEGEYMEIQCRRNVDTELTFYQESLWKSTADTEACGRFGAVLGNGSRDEVEALADFGRRLGYIFRLTDDMKDSLNFEGSLIQRLENESVPLPILHAAKSSRVNYRIIKSILQKTKITSSDAEKILELCFKAESFSYVKGLIKKNANEAIDELHSLKPSFARNALKSMIEKSIEDIAHLPIE